MEGVVKSVEDNIKSFPDRNITYPWSHSVSLVLQICSCVYAMI